MFNLDGSIRPTVTAAGYMFTEYYPRNASQALNAPFGTHVAPSIVALLHDHLASWKVDLDILGTANSLEVTEIKAGTYAEALASAGVANATRPEWVEPEFDEVRYTTKSIVRNETAYRPTPAAPMIMAVVNRDELNAFGVPRGYALMTDTTPHQLLRRSPLLKSGLSWTNHSMAFTLRKDDEIYLSDAFLDAHNLMNASTSFTDILNGEALQGPGGSQQDLTAWVTVGFIHLPRSEDIPLISNHAAYFTIKPYNYFNTNPAMNLRDEADDEFETCRPRVGVDYEYRYGF